MKQLLCFCMIITNFYSIFCFGLYGGFDVPSFGNYPRYGSYQDSGYNSRPYADSYGGYGPTGYGGGGYGSGYGQDLGSALGDISLGLLRSLSEFLIGPELEPFPYGPMGPFQPSLGGRNRYTSQYGHGVNAGVYAGTYGGQSISGPRGPYGGINTNIGGSYGGLSGWPIPWFPTIGPPAPPPTTTTTTTTTTPSTIITSTPVPVPEPEAPAGETDNFPIATVVEIPILDV